MQGFTPPGIDRITRKGAALVAARDELTRASYAALMETTPLMAHQTARLLYAIYGPVADDDEVEAGFDNLPL